LEGRSLLPAGSSLTETVHRQALEIRSILRGLLERDPHAQDRLEAFCSELQSEIYFDSKGVPRFRLVTEGFDRVLSHLLEVFIHARQATTWRRLKACQACGLAFYDHSRNRSGKWCTERCGQRIRAAKIRRQKKYGRR